MKKPELKQLIKEEIKLSKTLEEKNNKAKNIINSTMKQAYHKGYSRKL